MSWLFRAGACSWTGTFRSFSQRYSIDSLAWEVAGSFMSLDFSITQGDKLIARIEKAWPAFQDRYQLEIADEKDELTALASSLPST